MGPGLNSRAVGPRGALMAADKDSAAGGRPPAGLSGNLPGSGTERDEINTAIGQKIVSTLSSDFHNRSIYVVKVPIPEGISDIQALDVLNRLSIERTSRALIDEPTRRKFEGVASSSLAVTTARTYEVVLLVDGTDNLNRRKSVRRLAAVELSPADPLQTAIVLLASTLRESGDCFVDNYTIRTAIDGVCLRFDRPLGRLFIVDEPTTPDKTTMMAGVPRLDAPQDDGLWAALRRFFGGE